MNQLCIRNEECQKFMIGVCTKCSEGFSIDYQQGCAYNPNCEETNKSGICIKCKDQYFIDKDLVCSKNENCTSQLEGVGICSSCKDGMIVLNGECIESIGCAKTNETTGECIQCEDGLSINKVSGRCEDNKECIRKDAKNICVDCTTGYSVDMKQFVSSMLTVQWM